MNEITILGAYGTKGADVGTSAFYIDVKNVIDAGNLLVPLGEKSAENIIKEIENKKKIPFSRFLWALGILHVGEETARDLATHFGTLEKLITSANQKIIII